MTIPNRTVTIAGVFAEDALTTIPQTPSAGTSYRDTTLTAADAKAGWAYKTIVDSAKFNQAQYQYSSIASQIEKYGFLPWSNLTDYVAGSLCLGSNGTIYRAKQNTGPSSTVKDPTTDSALTYWEDFVGEEYIDYSRLSNCILKIPQSINLELASDGTLTLKAGSVITLPDGTQIQTTADASPSNYGSGTYQCFVYITKYGNMSSFYSTAAVSKAGSGSSLPEDNSTYSVFFNTTDSKMYHWDNNAWEVWDVALPVAIVTLAGGKVGSIDKVFNGAGYIGTSIFVLPDLTGLAPNGFNSDGTLASYKIRTSALAFYNQSEQNIRNYYIARAQSGGLGRGYWTEAETIASSGRTYIPSKNRVYQSNGTEQSCFRVCRYSASNGVIVDFEVMPVVRMAKQEDLDKKQDSATALNYNYISNCITSIPQDIKLELSSGTLTLKSGSVVTAPDGTQLTTTADKTHTYTTSSGQRFIYYSLSNNNLQSSWVSATGSGSSLPADGSTYTVFFNTTDSKIYSWNSGSSSWGVLNNSLPIAIVTISGGQISSIDKVFNGAGYIGYRGFVLPGVSVLRANGKNADGTLASIMFTRDALYFWDMSGSNKTLSLQNNSAASRSVSWTDVETYSDIPSPPTGRYYVRDENMVYNTSSGSLILVPMTLFVRYDYDGTSVTQFDVEQPIRLDDKASLGGNNAFTGTNTVPTQATTDNSTKIANTAFVKKAIESSATEPRDVTILWGDGTATVPQSSFELSEAFTNFEQIGFEFCQNTGYYRTMNIMSTYWLNFLLNQSTSSLPISFGYGPGEFLLSLRPYADTTSPSTTTNLSIYSQNVSSIYIFGINRKTIA